MASASEFERDPWCGETASVARAHFDRELVVGPVDSTTGAAWPRGRGDTHLAGWNMFQCFFSVEEEALQVEPRRSRR